MPHAFLSLVLTHEGRENGEAARLSSWAGGEERRGQAALHAGGLALGILCCGDQIKGYFGCGGAGLGWAGLGGHGVAALWRHSGSLVSGQCANPAGNPASQLGAGHTSRRVVGGGPWRGRTCRRRYRRPRLAAMAITVQTNNAFSENEAASGVSFAVNWCWR
ncbi:hypothetical protein E2C01_039112 [Portunus trituberculatus]|uniref:Uncharacterized protein n=1 Tax=Portunus trituberculatus TaxID=210409 RepID=A0A5B7FLV7_PORTR|nr:hypothetical protein [Portunus trituberculatus]